MTDFVSSDETKRVREMLDELLNVEDGLTNWEVKFIEGVNDWDGNFTRKQSETIVKLWSDLLGNKNTHT